MPDAAEHPVPAGLTAFQLTVATLFFSLPASDGFLLAGGAALAAHQLTSRPTEDLALFTRAGCGGGRYIAVCGADVLAHSLAAPPRRYCRACSVPDQTTKARR